MRGGRIPEPPGHAARPCSSTSTTAPPKPVVRSRVYRASIRYTRVVLSASSAADSNSAYGKRTQIRKPSIQEAVCAVTRASSAGSAGGPEVTETRGISRVSSNRGVGSQWKRAVWYESAPCESDTRATTSRTNGS